MSHREHAQDPPKSPTRYYDFNEYSTPTYLSEDSNTRNHQPSNPPLLDWASSSSSRHHHRSRSSDSGPGHRHGSSGSGRRHRRHRDPLERRYSHSASPDNGPRSRRRSDIGDTSSGSLLRNSPHDESPSYIAGSTDASGKDTTKQSFMQRLAGDKWVKGVEAAAGAAAVELFRSRHSGGSGTWRAVRVATAAFSAAAIETSVDGVFGTNGTRGVAESAVAGLLVNKIVNGSRREERY